MQKNYKKLGDYIQELKFRNTDQNVEQLLGINIDKFFMPSVANIIGTDLSVYKIVCKNQFACNRMHVGRDDRLPISMSKSDKKFLVSPAYDVFEIKDTQILDPEFLMMWFKRKEFDRNAWFYTDADVRGGLPWKSFCEMQLPVPSINKQREIVKEYNTIQNRIDLNNRLIQKLEETAQAIYRQWFVEFEFPDANGNPYKSSGGEMVWNEELGKEVPEGWRYILLKEKANYRYGKNLPTEKLLTKGYNVYGGNGIIGFIDNYIYDRPQVMISCRGAASGKIVISSSFCFITNNSIVLEYANDFEFCYLRDFTLNNSFEEYITGSAQPQITIENLKGIKLVWPSDLVLLHYQSVICPIYSYLSNIVHINEGIHTLKELLLSKMTTIEI